MASNDNLTAQGISAYEAGDTKEARRILAQAVKDNKDDEQAWYYLGMTQTDAEKRQQCFQMVLKINPNNAEAQAELAKASTPDNVMNMPKRKPGSQAMDQKVTMDYGLIKAIPGAPGTVSVGEVFGVVRNTVMESVPVFTTQAEVKTANATWWNFFLIVGTFSFIIGLITSISHLIAMLDLEGMTFDLLPLVTRPFLTMLVGIIGVTAGAFASHWYATKQAGGQGSLLQHSIVVGKLWIIPILILAVIQFVVFLIEILSDDVIGRSLQLEGILRQGFPGDLEGGTIALTILTLIITGYTAFLMAKNLGTLHGTGKLMWIPALLMLLVTAFVIPHNFYQVNIEDLVNFASIFSSF